MFLSKCKNGGIYLLEQRHHLYFRILVERDGLRAETCDSIGDEVRTATLGLQTLPLLILGAAGNQPLFLKQYTIFLLYKVYYYKQKLIPKITRIHELILQA